MDMDAAEERKRILLIDDEPQIRRLLKVAFSAHGYRLEEAASGEAGLLQAATHKPDVLVIDLGLPDMDGKEIVRRVREWSEAPILVLTARDQEQEKVAALDMGADDYVTKPFSTGELLARIRVCLRHSDREKDEAVIQCGALSIDLVKRRVAVEGREIRLTPTEYDIVRLLGRNAGRVLTHRQILQNVWGNRYGDDTHYVRVYIGQIRRKLERDSAQPRYIVTESGVGYRLTDG